jgi:hypothetical protein
MNGISLVYLCHFGDTLEIKRSVNVAVQFPSFVV